MAIREGDSGYATLIGQSGRVVSLAGVLYQRVTDNGVTSFYELTPSTELSSLRKELKGKGVVMRGWYPPTGVREQV